jgi:ribosomal protein S18 acetylase RimI-like enzyme
MKIREAKIDDVHKIFNLIDKLMDYHLKLDDYYKLLSSSEDIYKEYFENLIKSDNSLVLVVEDNGVIVGFLAGKIENRPPVFEVKRRGWIDSIFVLEDYRVQGIGKELTRKMLEWFKRRGISYVELSVDSRNEIGQEVWKTLGFKTWKKMMKIKI